MGKGKVAKTVSGSVVSTRGDQEGLPMSRRATEVRHDAISAFARAEVRTVMLLNTRIILTVWSDGLSCLVMEETVEEVVVVVA